MDLYTRLNLLVLALPLALSFDRKVAFWRQWPRVLPAIAAVVAVFGTWDVWKTSQGVWGFNPVYAGEIRLGQLPPGEWLFFICVPYACLFILACVRAYFRDRRFRIPRGAVFAGAGLLAVAAWGLRGRVYTASVVASVAIVLAALELAVPATLRSRNFWAALGLTYLPFLVVNGVLTGLPVVWYDDTQILGIRIGRIPLEDFFYSFSMLALAVLVQDRAGRRGRGAA
ncbi:MAG: lycopene cyclase domain-containing protein [Lentisphaerae bacterium]|nr:lycopene cyclase domain-containing protein [Lentisphaerota bacterium]